MHTPTPTAPLFTVAKRGELSRHASADEWMLKMWDLSTVDCYSALGGKAIATQATAWISLRTCHVEQALHRKTEAL